LTGVVQPESAVWRTTRTSLAPPETPRTHSRLIWLLVFTPSRVAVASVGGFRFCTVSAGLFVRTSAQELPAATKRLVITPAVTIWSWLDQ
jgi:hypothetical protein